MLEKNKERRKRMIKMFKCPQCGNDSYHSNGPYKTICDICGLDIDIRDFKGTIQKAIDLANMLDAETMELILE